MVVACPSGMSIPVIFPFHHNPVLSLNRSARDREFGTRAANNARHFNRLRSNSHELNEMASSEYLTDVNPGQ